LTSRTLFVRVKVLTDKLGVKILGLETESFGRGGKP